MIEPATDVPAYRSLFEFMWTGDRVMGQTQSCFKYWFKLDPVPDLHEERTIYWAFNLVAVYKAFCDLDEHEDLDRAFHAEPEDLTRLVIPGSGTKFRLIRMQEFEYGPDETSHHFRLRRDHDLCEDKHPITYWCVSLIGAYVLPVQMRDQRERVDLESPLIQVGIGGPPADTNL